MKDDSTYIDHIANSIDRILEYIAGKDQVSFEEDSMAHDAVVRQLEIMGEATKNIS